MTIDEAKVDLSIQLEVKRQLGKHRQADAILLGIEALKRVKVIRIRKEPAWGSLLPSETEE